MKPKILYQAGSGQDHFAIFCERNVIDLFSLFSMAYVNYISYQLRRRKNTKPV